jgi:hypothetical protein
METWDANPYYSPDKCELELVADLELKEPDYDFDMVVVWRHLPSDELYWLQDSGCSCPAPYEDVHSLSDLVWLSSDSFGELEREVDRCDSPAAKASFLRKMRSEFPVA